MASILTELATDAEKFAAGKGFEDDVCLVAAEIIGLPGQAT
jgi:hypothetical protein